MSENDLNPYLSTSEELVFLENDIRRRLLATFFRRCVREYTVEQLSTISGEDDILILPENLLYGCIILKIC